MSLITLDFISNIISVEKSFDVNLGAPAKFWW